MPKASISGASRWFHNKPIIKLSGRFRTDDQFGFTFFHEAADIVLHGKKEISVENVEETEIDQDKEEVKAFAAKILLKENELQQIIHAAPLDEEMIHEFTNKFRTPADVDIGRLQHLKLVPFHMGNGFRQRIVLFDKAC